MLTGDMTSGGKRSKGDTLSVSIEAILAQKNHPSHNVKETVMICACIIMMKFYFCLTDEEMKNVKNLCIESLLDPKPEGERSETWTLVPHLCLITLVLSAMSDKLVPPDSFSLCVPGCLSLTHTFSLSSACLFQTLTLSLSLSLAHILTLSRTNTHTLSLFPSSGDYS